MVYGKWTKWSFGTISESNWRLKSCSFQQGRSPQTNNWILFVSIPGYAHFGFILVKERVPTCEGSQTALKKRTVHIYLHKIKLPQAATLLIGVDHAHVAKFEHTHTHIYIYIYTIFILTLSLDLCHGHIGFTWGHLESRVPTALPKHQNNWVLESTQNS